MECPTISRKSNFVVECAVSNTFFFKKNKLTGVFMCIIHAIYIFPNSSFGQPKHCFSYPQQMQGSKSFFTFYRYFYTYIQKRVINVPYIFSKFSFGQPHHLVFSFFFSPKKSRQLLVSIILLLQVFIIYPHICICLLCIYPLPPPFFKKKFKG